MTRPEDTAPRHSDKAASDADAQAAHDPEETAAAEEPNEGEAARVAELRRRIQAGEYEIDAEAIARGILRRRDLESGPAPPEPEDPEEHGGG